MHFSVRLSQVTACQPADFISGKQKFGAEKNTKHQSHPQPNLILWKDVIVLKYKISTHHLPNLILWGENLHIHTSLRSKKFGPVIISQLGIYKSIHLLAPTERVKLHFFISYQFKMLNKSQKDPNLNLKTYRYQNLKISSWDIFVLR